MNQDRRQTTVGFIGLGMMGGPMAANLVRKGHALVVFDLDPQKVAPLLALGARAASGPADVARQASVVVSMVDTTAQAQDVIVGPGGCIDTAQAGDVIASMSTIDPLALRRMQQQLAVKGITLIDAPVSGMEKGARDGTLKAFVGGDAAALEKARPALQAMAAEITHLGAIGNGTVMKLMNNMLFQVSRITIAEALALGAKAGLDPAQMVEVLGRATANSAAFQYSAPRILARDFDGIRMDITYKDVELQTALAKSLGMPLFIATVAQQVYQMGRAAGLGGKDGTAIVQLYERWTGVPVAAAVPHEPPQPALPSPAAAGTTVGFIGLGQMGAAMAGNLLRKAHPLVVYDTVPAKVDALVALGAQAASAPVDVGRRARIVITMVDTTAQAEQVIVGAGGLIDAAQPGDVIVSMSTIDPLALRRMQARLSAKGVQLLDAPVSGMDKGAREGTLRAFVGGDASALERVRPVLQAMSSEIVHCGAVGQGTAMKLTNNLIFQVTRVLIAEALALGTQAGLDPRQMVDIIGRTTGNSVAFQSCAPRILARNFDGSRIDITLKDMELQTSLGKSLGMPMFVTPVAQQVYQMGAAAGLGSEDGIAVVKLYEGWTGTPVVARG